MIRRLRLQNWRAYDLLDLPLSPGTTFVVAPNGVGKTSLVEGLRWALFGDATHRPSGAVRLGAAEATVTAEIVLPDSTVLTISRSMPAKAARSIGLPVATHDGRPVAADDVDKLLATAFAADPAVLARLAVLQGAEDLREAAALDLRGHLCRLFGIEALEQGVAELRTRQKANDKLIRQTKAATGVTPARLRELRATKAAAEAAASAADDNYQRVAAQLAAAQQMLSAASAAAAARRAAEQRQERLVMLADQFAELTGDQPDVETLAEAVITAEQAASEHLDTLRRDRATAEGQAAAVARSLEELSEAAGTCPTCRRPLTAVETLAARAELVRDLAVLRDRIGSMEEDAALRQMQGLRALGQAVRQLGPPQAAPGLDPGVDADLDADPTTWTAAVTAAQQELDTATEQRVSARSAAHSATTLLELAEQAAATAEGLKAAYTQAALLSAADKTLTDTIATLLNDTIPPLTLAIGRRWTRMFADRGPLALDPDGAVSRLVNGQDLPFASFSTGEKMAAQMLLRLIVLEAATRGTFCWIDEPLDHLDPVARRHVASLLTSATRSGALRQVVVTTYEEPLVRRLVYRDSDVHVLHVRPAVET